MATIFEETLIGSLQLKNRFIRSATWEGLATVDGDVTSQLVAMMVDLAKGDVGLIISSHAYVQRQGQATPWQLGVDCAERVEKLSQMTTAVHQHGGKIFLQLAHAGIFAEVEQSKQQPVSVSKHDIASAVLTTTDIEQLVVDFSQAAQWAKQAGFDGVELHSGHGYLLSQFLSPAFNQRCDDYGGCIENRSRIHLEIYRAIRNTVGDDFPIIIKMNCDDFIDNGLTAYDSLNAAKLFADAGFDAIELSGGIIRTGKLSPSRPGISRAEKEAYFLSQARHFKEELDLPIILVGGMRSIDVADEIIQSGGADYISMSRPLICEPNLIKRWQQGDTRKACCLSDNLCFAPGFSGEGVHCVTRKLNKLLD